MKSRHLTLLGTAVVLATVAIAATPDHPGAVARAEAHARRNVAASFFGANQSLAAADVISWCTDHRAAPSTAYRSRSPRR